MDEPPCMIDGERFPAAACYNEEQMKQAISPVIEALRERSTLRSRIRDLEAQLLNNPRVDPQVQVDLDVARRDLDVATGKIRVLTAEVSEKERLFQRAQADLIGAEKAAKGATTLLLKANLKLDVSNAEKQELETRVAALAAEIEEFVANAVIGNQEILRLQNELANERAAGNDTSERVQVLQDALERELAKRADLDVKLVEREVLIGDLKDRLKTNSRAIKRLQRAAREAGMRADEPVEPEVPEVPRGDKRGAGDDFDEEAPKRYNRGTLEPFGGLVCTRTGRDAADAVMYAGAKFEDIYDIAAVRCLHLKLLMNFGNAQSGAVELVRDVWSRSKTQREYVEKVKTLYQEFAPQ